MLDTKR